MNSIYLEVFALGIAIALSPITIIVAILILLSPNGRNVGLGFLIGWVIGLSVTVFALQQLEGSVGIRSGERESPAWAGYARLVLGAFLIVFAIYRWRARGDIVVQQLPSWTRVLDRLTPILAMGLAAVWAGPTPKSAILLSAASTSIVEADLNATQETAAIIVLVISASLGVGIPIVWALYAGERASARLSNWREWLMANNTAIMAVVFAAAGVLLIGKGLSQVLG